MNNPNLSDYETVVYVTDGYKISANTDNIFIAKSNKDLANNPDLTGYGTVICDFEGYTRFADLDKLPKKMIIKGDIDWSEEYFEKLPDISESIVYGDFDCSDCPNLVSLEGVPQGVGGILYYRISSSKDDLYFVKDGLPYNLFNLPKDKEFVINGNLLLLKGMVDELPDLSNVIIKGNFGCSTSHFDICLEKFPKRVDGSFRYGECRLLEPIDKFSERVGGCVERYRHIRRLRSNSEER